MSDLTEPDHIASERNIIANGRNPPTPLLPTSEDSELHLIGDLYGHPDRVEHAIISGLDGDSFSMPRYGHYFDALAELTAGHGPAVDDTMIRLHLERVHLYPAPVTDHDFVAIAGAGTGAWRSHLATVLENHRRRRIIYAARDLEHAARNGADTAAAWLHIDDIRKAVTPDPVNLLDPELDAFLEAGDDAFDWLAPGLLERGDRVIVTGEEGIGKSTLLRQIAVQLAAGLDPFTLEEITPLQVLLVDCENSARQARRALGRLRPAAGDRYQNSRLRLRVVGHAIDITRPDVLADLIARITTQAVDVVVLGPLYKLITDDPTKELPARAAADSLDRLRAVRGSALVIEAHSPYADDSKRARPIRPYGASLWSRWPEFGLHLGKDGQLSHWRGQRDERAWPALLTRSAPWPWAPAAGHTADPVPWDGPTKCMADIQRYLEDHPDDEFSKTSVRTKLRSIGLGYRNVIVADALERLVLGAQIAHRLGPRNADLYRAANPETTTQGSLDATF